jgi:two-component system sensor kinase FixL
LWLARCLLRPMAALTKRATEVVRSAGPSAGAEDPARHTTEASGIAELDALGDAFARADAALHREAAATRRERDLLQSVIDGCGEVVFVKDTEGRYLLINSAGSRVLGRPAADVLGRTNETLMPTAVASTLGKTDREVMADGQVRFTEDTVLQDGQPRHFQSSKSPWRELGTGRVLGLIGVARDITDLRREEERRRAAEADLQRLARRATAGAMAGGIAHEVNQPLAALANYLDAARRLLDRADTPLDPSLVAKARSLMVQAGSEAVRAGEILRRLREFVGKGGAPPGPELVRPLLTEAVALALAGRPSDASRVRICIDEGVGAVWADRVAVQQVLVNLVRNALDATSSTGGQVSLTATRRAPTLTDAEMVEVIVADQGPGLAPEVRARLFEAFVSTKPDGMGMGLSVSRTIVEDQGGRIWTEPGPEGRGAAFHFTLVAVEPGAEACPG